MNSKHATPTEYTYNAPEAIQITWPFATILNGLTMLCFHNFPFLILAVIFACIDAAIFYTQMSGKVPKINSIS